MARCRWCGADGEGRGDCSICGATQGGVSRGRGAGEFVMQLIGLVSGEPTPFDGEYLLEYEPGREGTDPNGEPMLAHVVTTPNKEDAMRFADTLAARREWMRWDGNIRPDGRPSRPLTAFNVQNERL